MSKFCVKPFGMFLIFLTALQYLPYLIHDKSTVLLLIWSSGSGTWVGPGVFLTALQYLPYLIHDKSTALLSIWSPGSGTWVGPGVSSWDFANCCIFLFIVLMYLNGWSLVMQG